MFLLFPTTFQAAISFHRSPRSALIMPRNRSCCSPVLLTPVVKTTRQRFSHGTIYAGTEAGGRLNVTGHLSGLPTSIWLRAGPGARPGHTFRARDDPAERLSSTVRRLVGTVLYAVPAKN
jgi:hypothetical protein